MKKSTSNDGRLHEFIKKWSLTEWRKVQKLAGSKYLNSFRKSSEECLGLLISERTRLRKEEGLSFSVFRKVTHYSGTLDDWRHFTSEILKFCHIHLSISLTDEETRMAGKLGAQRYFAENGMWDNYDELLLQNKKAIFSPKTTNNSMQGLWMGKFWEIILSDIRNKEDRGQEEPFNNWYISNEFFYHLAKLRITSAYMGVSSFKNLSAKIEDDENLVLTIPDNIKHFPQIELYTLAYQLRKEKEDATFHALWERLDAGLASKKLSPKYIEPLYVILMSHCVIRARSETKGDEFRRYFLKIAYHLIDNDLLIEQGKLHSTHFRNIIISHLKLGENGKAIKFSGRYPKLLLNENHPIVKYCEALGNYHKGKYTKAYQALNGLPKDCDMNDYLKVDTKLLLLLVCLELDKHGQFIKEGRNVSLMIKRRESVSSKYTKAWEKTTTYLKEIYNVAAYEIEEQFPKIVRDINNEQHIRHKEWLLEYMDRKIKKGKPSS